MIRIKNRDYYSDLLKGKDKSNNCTNKKAKAKRKKLKKEILPDFDRYSKSE